MDKVNLPLENAREPDEEARQPLIEKEAVNYAERGQHHVTFANTTAGIAQNNSAYKNLSQPPTNLTHKEKLLWLQQRRSEGLWVQCDDCDNWRHLPSVLDSHELPSKWYCWMNPDPNLSTCSAPEVPIDLHEEEDLIHAEYAAGSLVLTRMAGYPWWPAMVDDCPDTEQYYWLDGFSDIPTHYNVVFFDAFDVTRAWIAPENLMPFKNNKKMVTKSLKIRKYRGRINEALSQANDAERLAVAARLAKYSFISRFNGKISTPKKINKKIIQKYQNKIKRKFHVDFCAESTDSEDEITYRADKIKTNRKILNKNTNAHSKVNSKSIDPDTVLTENISEISTNTLTKDMNSLTVQMDTDSGLIQSVLSEASNGIQKEQENSKISDSHVTESFPSFEDSQNSNDFDF